MGVSSDGYCWHQWYLTVNFIKSNVNRYEIKAFLSCRVKVPIKKRGILKRNPMRTYVVKVLNSRFYRGMNSSRMANGSFLINNFLIGFFLKMPDYFLIRVLSNGCSKSELKPGCYTYLCLFLNL